VNNAAVEVFSSTKGLTISRSVLSRREMCESLSKSLMLINSARCLQTYRSSGNIYQFGYPSRDGSILFFDGEHAETFSSETNYKAVGQAIRNMLGCNLVETAIDDLENATKTFNQLIGEVPGDEEIQEVTKILLDIDSRHTKAKDQLQTKMQDREATQDQITSILQKLRESEGAKDLQELRDAKVNRLKSVEDQLKAAEQAIVKWVGSKTLPLIASRLARILSPL